MIQANTIDELIDLHVEHYGVVFSYSFILYTYHNRIVRILISEYNKPSKHDLFIVNEINKLADPRYNDILEAYSKRK